MKNIRVLVTGAGSCVGQGIIKALNISKLPLTIVSADISPFNSGLYRTDEAVIIPAVEKDYALEKIIKIIKQNDISVVLVGSEFDLTFFSEHKYTIEENTKALVVVSPNEAVKIADDKWLTSEFLRNNSLPYAISHLPLDWEDAASTAEKWGYPVLLKARSGTSNRHVHIVHNVAEIKHIFPVVPRPMLQQLIQMPKEYLESEYTCSIFKAPNGTLSGPFTARRTLKGGTSWVIEVDLFEELYPLLLDIGKKMPAMGTLNIQLLVGKDGPVPFEFNARFSGTTPIRAHFGFNEPEMAIRCFFLKEELSQVKINKGIVLRYTEEVFLDDKSSENLSSTFTKGSIMRWF